MDPGVNRTLTASRRVGGGRNGKSLNMCVSTITRISLDTRERAQYVESLFGANFPTISSINSAGKRPKGVREWCEADILASSN